jgi:hypothetical protein
MAGILQSSERATLTMNQALPNMLRVPELSSHSPAKT